MMSGRSDSALVSVIACSIAVLCIWGCDFSERRIAGLESQLIDQKSERTALIEKLYTEYGGGALVRSLDDDGDGSQEAKGPEANDALLNFVRGVAEEGDRALFEEQVRVVGRGDRPVTVSTQVRDFFSRDTVRADCRRVVELDSEVERIERKRAGMQERPNSR